MTKRRYKWKDLMSKIYRTTVQEDAEGNAFIELPSELLKQLDWNEGDDLVWDETELCDDDGEFKGAVLYKKE